MRTRLTSSFLTAAAARSRPPMRPLPVALRVSAIGLLLSLSASGCNGGPSETEGQSASESESNSSSSTTGSSETASVTITTSSSSSTTDSTTSETTTTTSGGVACEGIAGFECAEPLDCDAEKCGPIDSHYDDEGCPRPSCTADSDCADG